MKTTSNYHIHIPSRFLLIVPLLLYSMELHAFLGHAGKYYNKALHSLVQIYSYDKKGDYSTGSGFVYDTSGGIVTNYHVIRKAKSLMVRHFQSESDFDQVSILYADPIRDIAILQIHGEKVKNKYEDKTIQPLSLHEANVGAGAFILPIINVYQFRKLITDGIVSKETDISVLLTQEERKRRLTDYNQHTTQAGKKWYYNILKEENKLFLFSALVGPGSSGSPILDAESGNVVGIVSGSVGPGNFINIAIPVSSIHQAISFASSEEKRSTTEIDWDSIEIDKDPYFKKSVQYSMKELTPSMLSGVVYNKAGDGIDDATVVIQFELEKDNPNTRTGYLTKTDHDGHFGFEVPNLESVDWKIDVLHPFYEVKEVEHRSGGYVNIKLQLSDEYSKRFSVFYAQPAQLNLDLNKRVYLYSEQLDAFKDPVTLDLSWRSSFTESWLEVDSTGSAYITGRPVNIDYNPENKPSRQTSAIVTFTSLPPAPTLTTRVEVFANSPEGGEEFVIDGFVRTIDGGSPGVNLKVTANIEGGESRTVTVSKDTYFKIPISKREKDKELTFSIPSYLYKLTHEKKIRLKKDQLVLLEVVPKKLDK